MLEVAFKDVNKDIYVQIWHGAGLFDVTPFKSDTRFTKQLVREMLFVNNNTFSGTADMQVPVKNFAKAVHASD